MTNPTPNPFRVARIEQAADAAVQQIVGHLATVRVAVLAFDPDTGAMVYRGAVEATVALQMLSGIIAQQFAQLAAAAAQHRGPQ